MFYHNKEKRPTGGTREAFQDNAPAIVINPSPVAKERQRAAVLEALKVGPVSSVELREQLGILHPSGRIMELRKQGHEIETKTITAFDANGRPHRCALFVLKHGGSA